MKASGVDSKKDREQSICLVIFSFYDVQFQKNNDFLLFELLYIFLSLFSVFLIKIQIEI
jgi:hypothetical protein